MQEEPMDQLPDTSEVSLEDNAQQPESLSRRQRSVTTSVGLQCEAGYKMVGDDCVMIASFE
ncbi:hypothetical protein [Pseudomonas sp. NBRC 111140]|uniref:hypothetical protein n=1 Tax=Pseudomonas sp. NBRC 111140 TaxID=1661055 RepID=UPI000761C1D0|nr:hypothetical protein [Pseudomonas sp. NBRC 111140]